MVEDAVPTFQAFCEHQDVATLAADQELAKQYEEVVKCYASFSGPKALPTTKTPLSAPVAIRWRSAGLQAIKSISASEAIGADGGRQLDIVMPVILENLHSDYEEQLVTLNQKASAEKDTTMRRRMSIATVRTSESLPETNTVAVSGTTADADRLAEEEVGLLALQSLKQIFSANNRIQIRMATNVLLSFLAEKAIPARPDTAKTARSARSGRTGSWATQMLGIVAKWTPVQDRFVIMVTAMEILVRSPILEDDMAKQLTFATLIDWLLSSTINMIGLSIMDVLLGLVQHILLLLQLGSKDSRILPHHQQTEAIDIFRDKEHIFDPDEQPLAADMEQARRSYDAETPSATRQELLFRLRKCVADLATHVYYSDQISDIISAILLRLKPSPTASVSSTVAAIEKPAAAAQVIQESASMKDDPNTHEFFSFGTARVMALNAIKDVLLTANKKGSIVGAGAIGRNRVGVQVWEGTQWLLRDEDRRVRRSYADALLTWLKLEMGKHDLRIMEDQRKLKKQRPANGQAADNKENANTATRAASTASHNGRAKPPKSTFIQLLHLAIYDNALESPESESDILLLHLLLSSLVEKLGVNAVKTGLPMIVRLQEDINSTPAINTPEAKVNIGSLVHGYLWALMERFEFDTTLPGYKIQTEISRRQKAGLWLGLVKIPPLPLERIMASSQTIPEEISTETVEQETLRPFDDIQPLVNQIGISYTASVASPPSSPPTSPSRVLNAPIFSPSGLRSSVQELPARFRDAMLSRWSKEACIASVEKDTARTISPHGSRPATTHSAPNGLLTANGHTPRDGSPAGAAPRTRPRDKSSPKIPPQTSQLRRSSANISGPPTPMSSSDHTHTLRVDDLKRVLAGGSLAEAFATYPQHSSGRGASPLRNSSVAYQDFGNRIERAGTRPSIISAGSDSMVDAEGFESASEGDPEHALPSPQSPIPSAEIAHQLLEQIKHSRHEQNVKAPSDGKDIKPTSRGNRPRSGSETSTEDPVANANALKADTTPIVVRGSIVAQEGVPPVPPLPEGLVAHPRPDTLNQPRTRDRSIGKSSDANSQSMRGERRTMIQALLGSIEVGEVDEKSISRPPY